MNHRAWVSRSQPLILAACQAPLNTSCSEHRCVSFGQLSIANDIVHWRQDNMYCFIRNGLAAPPKLFQMSSAIGHLILVYGKKITAEDFIPNLELVKQHVYSIHNCVCSNRPGEFIELTFRARNFTWIGSPKLRLLS